MIGKLDTFWASLRDLYPANSEMAMVMSAAVALIALVAALKFPGDSAAHKNRARIARFCLNCPYFDGPTETCAMGAMADDKCGLVDRRAGMTFTVTKN